MKTRLLIAIGIIFISGLIYANSAHALPFISPEYSYENAKHVVIGKVLSVEILSEPYVQKSDNIYSERFGFALYEIQVEDYLKNPLNNSTMNLLGKYTNQRQTMSYEIYPYEINQRVLLYIQEIHNIPGYELIISAANSRVIPEEFSSEDVMSRLEYNTSPLKQIKNGVALIDVQCSDGKYAVYKYNRMRVACVSEETQNELWSRGWATMRLSMPGDDISHALCNNYGGKWHPEYDGCRDISDLQCSLIGGKFVDDLKICEDGICPDRDYEICVTESENDSSKISESQPTQSSDTGLQVHVTGQQQVRRGTTHDITVDVTRNGNPVSDSLVIITIEDYGKDIIREFEGQTDDSGRFVFSWEIPKSFDDIETLLAYVDVTDDISAKTVLFKFQVYCLPGESGCKVEGN